MFIVMCFSYKQSFEEQGVGVQSPYGSLLTQHILWFYMFYIFFWGLCCCDYIVRAQAASSCKAEKCLCGVQYSSNYMISISIFLLPLCYISLELDLLFFSDNFSNEWWHRWCKWYNSVDFNLVQSAYRPQAYCDPVTFPPFWPLVDVNIVSYIYK